MSLHDVERKSETTIPTASQTVGPFFSIGMCPLTLNNLVPANLLTGAEVVTVRGRVLDGDGQGVPDAILEIWRADNGGNYSAVESDCDARGVPSGFARIPTNDRGEFEFQTLKPGTIVGNAGGIQAPHLQVLIFMRGLLRHLVTRIHFPQDPANEHDPVLRAVPAERRSTLIAMKSSSNQGELRWNVCLQGDSETVFFEA
jgi:protocatechuate 3,4-dioxygenase alpha subunit